MSTGEGFRVNQRSRQLCNGCDILPSTPGGPVTLYLAPPVSHLLGRIERAATATGLFSIKPFGGALAVTIADDSALLTLADELATILTLHELSETLALTVPVGAVAGIADFVRARPLSRIVAQARGKWFSEILAEKRLVIHFQPIVRSCEPTQILGYECLTRGRLQDGTLVSPDILYQTAIDMGLLYYFDRAARTDSVRIAAEQAFDELVFVNFRPSAVYNPRFCLQSTVRAVTDAGIAPERIVFEVVESEEVADTDHLIGILDMYRSAGFRVALDDLGAGYGSLNLIHRLQPDFIKLDMGLVRNVDSDPIKGILAAKLLEAAAELGIPSIAEGVETVAERTWLRHHGAIYQQGFLFARPAFPPPMVTKR